MTSRQNDFLLRFEEHLREKRFFKPRQKILVACSGGPDSMALALAVAHLTSRGRAPVADAVVIDHQLQDGSAVVAQRVIDRVRRHGASMP